MNDRLPTWLLPTSTDSHNVISSRELEGGRSRSSSPDGQQIDLSGLDHARASRTAPLASNSATPTNETSGQHSSISSASAALCLSSGSKLQARLATVGSMEYAQTWRLKATPLGLQYWAHTASARPTSGSDCSGWPTPMANNATKDCNRYRPDRQNGIGAIASIAGWATPTTRDHKNTGDLTTYIFGSPTGRIRTDSTSTQAFLAAGENTSGETLGTGKKAR